MKSVLKFGALGAVAAGAVVLVRRYDLVNRSVALANSAAEVAAVKAERFFVKAVGVTDDLLTRAAEKLDEQAEAKDPSADDQLHEDAYLRRTMGYGDVR